MFRFKNLSQYKEIDHFISDRLDGISPAPFDSLNIGFNTKDDPKNVLKNRELLSKLAGFNLNNLVTQKQTHSNNVTIVTDKHRSRGSKDYQTAIDDSDALITRYPDILLMVQVADCVPILIYDPKNKVIASVHAGWRGTVKLIADATVKAMKETFGSNIKDLIAGIGPSIGPCCYEVGGEVLEKVGDMSIYIYDRNGHKFFDLWEANKSQLVNAGLNPLNIELSKICTMEHSNTYFSSRASNSNTGRFGAGIILR